MKSFFKTVDTVDSGMGFSHFDALHITWLAAFLCILILSILFYRKADDAHRKQWKRTIVILLLADELFKVVVLVCTGQYTPAYLPLHLCSINIFVIAWHAWKPSKLLGNFLYTVCIPGTMAAMLFPSWTQLPFLNAMHLHSFSVHILLALYPMVLVTNGELRPEFSDVFKSLGLLILLAIPVYAINLWLDTNFMFLMYADQGNPLYWFGENWGSHLWGFPVIIAGVLLIMYGPLELYRKTRIKRFRKT